MSFKLISWNVNSLRSAIRQGFLDWLRAEKPDVLCLQEVRAMGEQLRSIEGQFEGYRAIWHPAERPGYAGVAVLARVEPVGVELGLNGEADPQGRSLTVDFGTFRVGSFYAPNADPGSPKIQIKEAWLRQFQKHLSVRVEKPFVIAGDLNVACTALDSGGVAQPWGMNGCTDVERRELQVVFDRCGLFDPARHEAGDALLSTWWDLPVTQRSFKNGMRYDYILFQKKHQALVMEQEILFHVDGSDHCPVSLTLDVSTDGLHRAETRGQGRLL